jgi:4-hydroxyproline epimerase
LYTSERACSSAAGLDWSRRINAISSELPIPRSLRVIDSHTAGEPTRVVLPSGPEFNLGGGSLAERLACLRTKYDHLRRAILCEPRGSDVLVGAWLLEPDDADCDAAVIFFNNAGYLGMCGHGTIGVAATLAHLGRAGVQTGSGELRIQTPVGVVPVRMETPDRVTIDNVPASRYRSGVTVDVPEYGPVTGDVAWGGNWFFLAGEHRFALEKAAVDELTDFTWRIRLALSAGRVNGADGAEIDHIELFTAAHDPANDSRNFVLCPGKAYDRSPCGTGTSAKLACLAADGKLGPGKVWRQEGILGTVFEGSYRWAGVPAGGKVNPSITGSAYITSESTLLFDPSDPFRAGISE